MDASSPEPLARNVVLPRVLLAGAAVGVAGAAGGSLVLYQSTGLLAGATGLAATLLLSLVVGLWAGAPGALEEELPLRDRWLGSAAALALAGAFATFWTLYGGARLGAPGRVLAMLVLVALPVYAAGMLLPALLAWAERWMEDGEAEETGWGGVGIVAGGSVSGAALAVVLSGLVLVPWLGAGPLLLAASLLLLLPLAAPAPEPPAPAERLLHEVETAFGTLRVSEVVLHGERQPERRLYLDEEQESGELIRSGAPTLAYVAAAEAWLAAGTPPGGSYLFLGGGAYTLPRRVAERDPSARITVVELNPEATRLAYRFFGLRREHSIASIHGDARAFLERAGEAQYDRIYLDVYAGEESVPYSLVTREAFAAARRRLRPDGLLGMNLIGVTEGAEALKMWSVVRTLRETFPTIALYTHLGPRYPERQNVLALASPEAGRSLPARAGVFDRWPEGEWEVPAGALVFRDLFPAGRPEPSRQP